MATASPARRNSSPPSTQSASHRAPASARGTRGTDPHDPASVLRLSQLDKSATGMQMQFPTLTGKPSASLRPPGPIASNTPDLTTHQWHPLTAPIPGDVGTLSASRRGKPVLVEDPAATTRPQRFYRLIVVK